VSNGGLSAEDTMAGKYLTFKLGGEEYGLEILKVREIIGLMDITIVPRTPAYVRGVINLRGKIIPVVELRVKFGMESIENTEETCIIVVEVVRHEKGVEMGILVDKVSEVLDINDSEIEDAPSFGAGDESNFIMGMANAKDSVKILLNIDAVLSGEEIVEMIAAGGSAAAVEG
jgi:purine-binding chemotaxis protein CheW